MLSMSCSIDLCCPSLRARLAWFLLVLTTLLSIVVVKLCGIKNTSAKWMILEKLTRVGGDDGCCSWLDGLIKELLCEIDEFLFFQLNRQIVGRKCSVRYSYNM